ncbi:N-acetylneuraminate synthase family protein [Nocardioides sp.]|uniref:N-acetylneuraminate synthase family protein n=1 Tax=Nocardioides sp. TaxID=35761 RepID=UPI0037832A35
MAQHFGGTLLRPYIIAEIGMNYEGSMARAKAMIEAAARGGAQAAKFQSYQADTLASRTSSPAYWDLDAEPTESQHQLFSKYDAFGPDEYAELAAHCRKVGIDFMSTPFDLAAVDYLEPLVPMFKIASADITNVPLIRKVARTGKPVVVSVGAASDEEIHTAVELLEAAGAQQIALLHCVLNYPTLPANANVAGIRRLTDDFHGRAVVGYSDHVAPDADGRMPAVELAAAFGAVIVEKHFTDDRNAAGNDHYHAMDEDGLRHLVERLQAMAELAGTGVPDLEVQRSAISNARRRIFTARPVAAGAVIAEDDLIALRADTGVAVAAWDTVVGARLTSAKEVGEPLTESDLETNAAASGSL